MSDMPSIRREDIPPANENFLEIVAAFAHFRASLHALRDLLVFIGPHEAVLDNVEKLQSELFTSTMEGVPAARQPRAALAIMDLLFSFVTPGMSADGATFIERLRTRMAQAVVDLEAGRTPDPTLVEELEAASDPATLKSFVSDQTQPPPDMQEAANQLINMVQAFGDARPVLRFNATFARQMARVSRGATLRRALIVNAVTAFEVLLSALVSAFYHEHPDALDALEREEPVGERFTTADALTYATIDELRDALIERRVDAILRGGLARWERWFRSTISVTPRQLASEWDVTREVFQRRNLFVHTGGRVSPEYLKNVASDAAIGTNLDASAGYVHRALDRLTILGSLLVTHAQWRWFEDFRPAFLGLLQQIIYDEWIGAEQWRPVALICEGVLGLGLDPGSAAVFRANRWLGYKRGGTLTDAHQQELRAWETDELLPVYALVRLALLDDLDALIDRLPGALDAREIDLDSLRTWAVFAELRADPRFAERFH
jgi:hypothetical protein